ncbi:hypothetical protein FRX31_032359 [Thalictrum thalictroides]|uniref:Ubiquitin-like domain-containing protein n=1 Tax=Thalictrum thalictroides TaxID=46969 RepID=A0A7J6UZG8_THATH|nr:hypothetical protein FRX31_032359 [Thalictrum thalictroides]
MKLVVEVLTGTLFYIQVDDGATIGDLKREIGVHEKVSLDRFILVHHDHYLMDDNGALVIDYGVQEGSHLHLCYTPTLDDNDDDHHHFFFTIPDSLFLYGP